MKRKNIIILIIIILVAAAAGYYFLGGSSTSYVFSTEEVSKGSVNITITATGTLEATETVEVGTQVSGVIEKLYVDFNSKVKKGQLIAELDKSTLKSTLETAEADVSKAQAEYDYQQSNLKRNKMLFEKEMLAQSDYDLVVYNYKLSEASLKASKANLDKAKRNLGYASIYSPIDGVVLNRAVEEGQTVAASMSTPELYTITNDLSTMQVEADVDEADIGQVKTGQRVTFTVDAFPDDTFTGKISEVRLQPTESSNVITYTVIVTVENKELKLKPGMTASITAFVEEATNVLVMPGKALRFSPDREMMQEYMSSLPEDQRMQRPGMGAGNKRAQSQNQQRPSGPPPEMEEDDTHKLIWIKEGDMIKPVPVEIGVNDGSNIEVISGLNEGDLVVTAMEKVSSTEVEEDDEQTTASSPFVPERPGKGKGPGH